MGRLLITASPSKKKGVRSLVIEHLCVHIGLKHLSDGPDLPFQDAPSVGGLWRIKHPFNFSLEERVMYLSIAFPVPHRGP